MPDMEGLTDKLRIDMARLGYKAKGNNADFWEGYRSGKSQARREVLIVFIVLIVLYSGFALRLGV